MLTGESMGEEKRIIEFNVKFITPLLIGGNPKTNDYNGKSYWQLDEGALTGKALRGCWRFWFRAIVGGMVKDIKPEEVYFLESLIFGSSNSNDSNDEITCPKFRITIEPKNEKVSEHLKLGFRNLKGKGFLEDTKYTIKIIPRKNTLDTEINILLATIWVWGNLGAIGKRSRRGFGSPVISLSSDNNIFVYSNVVNDKLSLPIKETFENREELQSHLKNALFNIWLIYKNWIENKKVKHKIFENICLFEDIESFNSPADDAPYFILRNCKQVSVANKGYQIRDDAIIAVHGRRNCYGMGWAVGNKRMASPVFIRFHQIKDELFPVVTWCRQQYVSDNVPNDFDYIYCLKEFLDSIHVTTNLNGGLYE